MNFVTWFSRCLRRQAVVWELMLFAVLFRWNNVDIECWVRELLDGPFFFFKPRSRLMRDRCTIDHQWSQCKGQLCGPPLHIYLMRDRLHKGTNLCHSFVGILISRAYSALMRCIFTILYSYIDLRLYCQVILLFSFVGLWK
jgi:hypothetical protein